MTLREAFEKKDACIAWGSGYERSEFPFLIEFAFISEKDMEMEERQDLEKDCADQVFFGSREGSEGRDIPALVFFDKD